MHIFQKFLATVALLVITAPQAFACSCVLTHPHHDTDVSTKPSAWQEVGMLSQLRNDGAVAVFRNRLWFIGGTDTFGRASNEVYASADGKTWKKEGMLPEGVSNHTVTVFRRRLWVMGGTETEIMPAVFSSADGRTWKREPEMPAALDSHATLVFKNRMFVLGGHIGGTERPTRTVYATSDGKIWEEQGHDALPVALFNHAAVNFRGKMFVIGGGYPEHHEAPSRAVLSSSDGVTWKQMPDALPEGIYCLTATVFKGKIWVLGGVEGNDHDSHYRHIVLTSKDGVTWKEEPTAALPVHAVKNTSVVFKNAIWILGAASSAKVLRLSINAAR